MKNLLKHVGIITIIAVIGLFMGACNNNMNPPPWAELSDIRISFGADMELIAECSVVGLYYLDKWPLPS